MIDGLSVRVTSPSAGLSRVALRWRDGVHEDALVLGDAWERSYGDLGWQHVRPERVLPWYWLATSSGHYTRGAGVRVRPGAMSYWTVDTDGVTLWLDVRSGSEPVELGGRELEAATVVAISAVSDVSAFSAQKTLCAALCSDSRALRTPLVGANNWYYAYGSGFDAQAVRGSRRPVAYRHQVLREHDHRCGPHPGGGCTTWSVDATSPHQRPIVSHPGGDARW